MTSICANFLFLQFNISNVDDLERLKLNSRLQDEFLLICWLQRQPRSNGSNEGFDGPHTESYCAQEKEKDRERR